MAYRIQYSPESGHRYPQVTTKRSIRWSRWLTLLLIAFALLWMRVNGIPDFLIPGDPEITKTATVTMIDSLREGASMGEAVTTFCKEIIDGATF